MSPASDAVLPTPTPAPTGGTKRKLVWIAALYFIQGLPFGIFYDAVPVYFRMHGVALVAIGLLSFLQLPWSLKVLWSPLVDRLGSPRRWILGALMVLALVHLALPRFDPSRPGVALWALLGALTLAAATQDVAIDAAFVRYLTPAEQGIGNGVRVAAFRAAVLVGGGATVMLASVLAWPAIFTVLAALFVLLAFVALRAPATRRRSALPTGDWVASFWRWLRQPAAVPVFVFVLVYKLGDASIGPMIRPFWVDRGLSPAQIGFATTTLGVLATTAGALAGGWYTGRRGVFRALWVLGLAQAASNLVYALVAYTGAGLGALYTASLVESFTGGLGTAALLSFLTRSCDPEHAATEYAMLSALFGLTRTIAGGASGWGAEHLGFASYFALTFVLALPAYALLPWVQRWLAVRDDGARAELAIDRPSGTPPAVASGNSAQ